MKVTFAIGEGWLKIKTLYRNSQQKFQLRRYDISTNS